MQGANPSRHTLSAGNRVSMVSMPTLRLTQTAQGPQIAGWFDRWEPRFAEGLHLIEALLRSPWALASLLAAAGPGAEEQVGKIRARQQRG